MKLLLKIKELCKNQGISIAELERKAGIGNGIIARWNKSTPSSDNLKKVADCLGVTLDYLMGNEPESKEFESETERKIRILTWKSEKLDDVEREEVLKHFERTIDVYLKAKGIEKRDD